MMFIKTFVISALFVLTAFTSVAMANDINPDPQGTVIELNAGSTHETTEQVTSNESTTTSNSSNEAVLNDLQNLSEMARQSFRTGTGWE